jgi:outer membrane protein OmpA-like peptidoglycan-associated protein
MVRNGVRHGWLTGLCVALAIPFCLAATGCSDKMKAQNDSLMKQNKALTDQLNAEKANSDAQAAEMDRLRAAAIANSQTPAATQPGTPDMSGPDMSGTLPPPTGDLPEGTITRSKNKHGESQLEVGSDVLFDSGSYTLKPSAKRVLERVVSILKKEYAGADFRVEGYTDSRPFKKTAHMDNQKLGLLRAKAVAKFLESKGISSSHLTTISFGASDPKSKTNLALNRRVDIVVAK